MSSPSLIGESRKMNDVCDAIDTVAPSSERSDIWSRQEMARSSSTFFILSFLSTVLSIMRRCLNYIGTEARRDNSLVRIVSDSAESALRSPIQSCEVCAPTPEINFR